jgi:hypothetical protein
MHITELDSYRLGDAVKFHNRLNPKLWGKDEHLLPDVRTKLLEIAADFQEFLGIADLDVEDITISGSNAAFSYTPHSDIDLHLVVRKPADSDQVYQELFNAKKYQYNDMHDIRIHGADVELYVQDANETPVSLGEYSIKNSNWIQVPRKQRAKIDQSVVKHKYEDLVARIQEALKTDDADHIAALLTKIKNMRQTGLDQHGEFGPENLAFKILRKQGHIQKLYAAQAAARDRELSLQERKKKKKRVRYGFGGYNMSVFGNDSGSEDAGGGESVKEHNSNKDHDIVQEFIQDTAHRLGIENMPTVELHQDADWSRAEHSFGMYEPESHTLHVNMANRHLMDILRTTAHELTHCRQNEISPLPDQAGETGSKWENQANATAGVIMRDYADAHPELFEKDSVAESSGYIPTAAKKNDPRFKTALSVDIRPGATGREANKMALQTGPQGEPTLLIKGLRNALREFKETGRIKEMDRLGNQDVTGPETPPEYPAGTTKIDVSDTLDWYRLGQDISNIARAKKKNYNQGPPHTVVVFPSDEMEQPYLKQFKRLGLGYHDIDPKGQEDIDESLTEDQDLLEVRMTPTNLRKLAAQTGAQAGMEFEMIVPDVGTADVEPEYEPDYDQDQRTRSFDDIRQFFHDGDYNGRRQVDNLIEEIEGEYREWQMDQTAESWERGSLEFITDYVSLNDLFDRDEAMLTARDEVMDANPDLPQESEDFTQLLSARLDEMERAFAARELEDQGRIYNDAFEAFSEEQADEYDERSFLDDRYPYMQDVSSNFDISWPYYIDINADSDGGGADIDRVADEFSSYMGKPVNASRQYHGGRREAGTYVVEPDGSLEGDNAGDEGLEFVSPPMPIDEMISDLNKVKAWADKTGCYTNESTGLHINISVPNYSLEKLDYVKLALLMGDEYILDLFDRSGNTYAKSAISKIKGMLQKNPDVAPQVMNKMREHMEDLATKAIHTGTTDKYTSINTKSGYIEFRSPGGDWLDANFSKIENTLLRFTVALSAAIDPEAYRQEYLKKLYKLLEGSQEKGGPDVLQLFANYSAGELDKAALIRQVRQQQLARGVAKGKNTGKMWWRVGLKSNPNYAIEVVGATRAEAIQAAKDADSNLRRFNYDAGNDFTAKPVRAYEETPAQAVSATNQGNWGVWITSAERFAREPNTIAADNVLRRFPSQAAALAFLERTRESNPNMRNDIEVREIEPSVQNTGSATSGNWGVWVPSLDRYATVGNAGPRRFENRAGAEAWIQDYNQRHAGNDLELQVREIEPTQPQFQEPAPGRGNLTPTGPGPWEIYRISDNSAVRALAQTNRQGAETEARAALGLRGEAPELYGVRTRGSADAAQGGTVDVATDRAAPQTLTRPGQGQQTFTGNWLIKDASGSVLHRFGGIGNSQSDANRIAMQWLRSNPRLIAGGVEVVPEMQ